MECVALYICVSMVNFDWIWLIVCWAIRAWHFLFHVLEHWLWWYMYFICNVISWNVNCTEAKKIIRCTNVWAKHIIIIWPMPVSVYIDLCICKDHRMHHEWWIIVSINSLRLSTLLVTTILERWITCPKSTAHHGFSLVAVIAHEWPYHSGSELPSTTRDGTPILFHISFCHV